MKIPFIRLEPRDKPEPVTPRHPWLLPLLAGVAILVVVLVFVYMFATGTPFF